MTTIDKLDPDVPLFVRSGINLASAGLGAKAISATDEFFAPLERMLDDDPAIFYPDRFDDNGKWMDGWETRRRREPGYDWLIVALGARGTIDRAVVDTHLFKGNYPDSCTIQAADLSSFGDGLTDALVTSSMFWDELLPRKYLKGHEVHEFDDLADLGPVTHVRFNIHPDGGVSRLRLFGKPEWRG